MRAFIAFLKKEILENIRSGRFVLLGILFLAFGIMNPAIAKLTPWLLETLAADLEESGMVVTAVTVDALTSWTQFFKNIPMALIAFVLVYSGSFTREYESGTLILMLTKGLSRYKVVLAKASVMLITWSAGYLLCYGVTYAYNAYFWDNSVARELGGAIFNWWLYGTLIVCLTVLFSVLAKTSSGVLLGVGGSAVVFYLIEMLPKIKDFSPSVLMNTSALLVGAESAGDYLCAVVTTIVLCIFCIAVSIPLMNKKKI